MTSAPEARGPDPKHLAAIARAKEEAIERSSGTHSQGNLVWNEPDAKWTRANQYEDGCWIHGPARIELFAASDQDLQEVAKLRGIKVDQVTRVRVAVVEETKVVLVVPVDENEPKFIEVKRYGSSAWINAITALSRANLRVKTGYQERYSVSLDKQSAAGPALKIDMSILRERKRETAARKKAAAAKAARAQKKKTTGEPGPGHE